MSGQQNQQLDDILGQANIASEQWSKLCCFMKGIILPTFMVIIISYYIDPYQSTKYSGMSAKGPRVLNVAMSNEKIPLYFPIM